MIFKNLKLIGLKLKAFIVDWRAKSNFPETFYHHYCARCTFASGKTAKFVAKLIFILLLGCCGHAYAELDEESGNPILDEESGNPIFHEVKGTFGFNQFGTNIGLFNGRFSTTIPVISIPGNSKLDVGVYLQSAPDGVYTTPQPFALPIITGVLPCDYDEPVWLSYLEDLVDGDYRTSNRTGTVAGIGTWLHIPGRAPERIGRVNSSTAYTLGNYYYVCSDNHEAGNGPGDAPDFTMTVEIYTPSGTKYVFNQMDNPNAVEFGEGTLYASHSEDVYGNRVDYIHNDGLLEKILASDGREITFEYNNQPISSDSAKITIGANGRQWVWTGRWTRPGVVNFPNTSNPYGTARELTLPDNTKWTFNATANAGLINKFQCNDGSGTIIIKTPQGAQLNLSLENKIMFSAIHNANTDGKMPPRSQYNCKPQQNLTYYQQLSRSSNHPMVVSASIIAPRVADSYTWEIEYEEVWGRYVSNSTPYTFPLSRRIIKPDGSTIEYKYESHKKSDFSTSLLSAEVKDSDGNVMAMYEPEYSLSRAVLSLHGGDTAAKSGGTKLKTHQLLLTGAKTTIGDDVFSSTYQYGESGDWDKRNIKTQVVHNSVHGSQGRITDYEYKSLSLDNGDESHHIGLLESIVRNGKQFVLYHYNSKGELKTEDKLGTGNVTSYSYNSQGLIHTITNPIGRVDEYTSYKRGQAQNIKRAAGTLDQTIETVVVDNNGWVTSKTDPLGHITDFSFDSMGRVEKISYGGRQRVAETRSYNSLASGLVETITNGDKRTTLTYDGLSRLISEKIEDLNHSIANVYQTKKYDALGRVIFSSWPANSATPLAGEIFEFDALGRLKSVAQNVTPFVSTTFQYLSGDRKKITDADNIDTTITYGGYYPFSEKEPLLIESAEDVTTSFTRNIWGLETHITQSGEWNGQPLSVTQIRYYNDELLLCSQYTPETGYTRYSYDNATRVSSYQLGASSGSMCQLPDESSKITLTYDMFGRNTKTDFAHANTADIEKVYDLNGNLENVERGGVNWAYIYDNLNQLTDETLLIDGLAFHTHYDYNLSGSMSSITYPSGDMTSLSPNVYGQPSAIVATNQNFSTVYATGIEYYPSQILKTFEYGNGLKFEQGLNERLLPETRKVWSVSDNTHNHILNYDYGYDRRSNVVSIIDKVNTERTIDNTYDDLSRLLTSNSSFGNITFSYDPIGNLRKRQVIGGNTHGGATHNVSISYNNLNQVSQISDINGNRSFEHDNRGNVKNNGKDTLLYDFANQPISINGDTDAFTYDGNLKRVKKTTGGQDVYFVYTKGAGLISQYNKSTKIHTDHIKLRGKSIARVESVGSAADLTSSAFSSNLFGLSETTTSSSKYSLPFGKSVGENSPKDSSIGFTGHVNDDSGLVYMQARYYDPVIGRFYSNDPVDALGHMTRGDYVHGFNRYSYAANNPYKYTDPDGKLFWGAVIGAGVELIAQVATGQDINITDIAIAGAVGAVTGGFAGRAATQAVKGAITGSRAVAQTTAVSGVSNGVGSVASDLANGNDVDLTKAATSTVAGAAGGFVGAKGANAITNNLDNLSDAGGIASQISNTTRSSYVGSNVTEQLTSGGSTAASAATDAALSVANKELNENN